MYFIGRVEIFLNKSLRSLYTVFIESLLAILLENSEITEDDLKGLEDDIQKLTDAKVKEIDNLTAAKEKEIMSI